MFIPPWSLPGSIAAMFGVGGTEDAPPAPAEPAPETIPTPPALEPVPDVPTLAEAVEKVRRDMRSSVALQPKGKRDTPPLIVVIDYVELDVIVAHVEAELADQEVAP